MRWLFGILLLIGVARVKAQEVDSTWARYRPGVQLHNEFTLLVGYHQGTYGYAELGIGRNMYAVGHIPAGMGYYLGSEMRLDRPDLFGVKVGAYVTGGFAMGVQLIQYFEGDKGCTVLRPEIGIGLFKAKMTYAYNIGLSPERLSGINTHMLSLSYAFRMLRLPGDDEKRPVH